MIHFSEGNSNILFAEQNQKRKDVEAKIAEILLHIINKSKSADPVNIINEDIFTQEITSINFIEILVAVETAFNIEFSDEELEYGKISSLRALAERVLQMIPD
jgi:acyl carrier protein